MALRCPYGHDAFESAARRFECRGCGAAHHVECFAAHGRCSVMGCSGRAPEPWIDLPPRPPPPAFTRGDLIGLFVAVVALVVAAAINASAVFVIAGLVVAVIRARPQLRPIREIPMGDSRSRQPVKLPIVR